MERLQSNGEMLSQIDLKGVPHSSFDRSKHNYGSGRLGKIIPTRVSEVYPGDRIVGTINDVTNFEPLAGPAMGTMYLKQEAFYIPYIEVWKNAYNFFTGKNGYSGSIPSISPRQLATNIMITITSNGQVFNFGKIISDIKRGKSQSEVWSDFSDELDDSVNVLDTFAERNKLVDVLSPVRKWMEDFRLLLNDAAGDPSIPDFDILNNEEYAVYFCTYLYHMYEYLFGVSSLWDYIGWPIMDNYQEFFLSDDSSKISVRNWILGNGYVSRDYFQWMDTADSAFLDLFSDIPLSFLPFRAWYAVWYWNYRDELLESDLLDPESDEFLADTIDNRQSVVCSLLRPRCWYKDTYTTALTNTGSGNLGVPVVGISDAINYQYFDGDGVLVNTKDAAAAKQSGATVAQLEIAGVTYKIPMNYLSGAFVSPNDSYSESMDSALYLDMFDRVRRYQRFLQKKLILGYEVDDVIWSSFFVRLSNVHMRIPELLARGRDEVSMNVIVNNTNTAEQIAGDKTAVAFASGSSSRMNYFAEEWGLFMSFKTIMPVQTYTGGLKRLWFKRENLDFMWPEFSTMGMDAVYNFELSAPRGFGSRFGLTDEQALAVFGYQGRYYDLKSATDEAHGRMRTDLNYLLFSREFNSQHLPKLNYIFVHCWPSEELFVVADGISDVFRYDVYFDTDWERRLPVPSEIV